MKKLVMKHWLLIAVAIFLIASVAAPVSAGNYNRKLYGDYAANFMMSCGTCSNAFTLGNPQGTITPYNPACLPIPPSTIATSTTYTWNTQGVYTFDGEGKVGFTGRYLAVLRDPISGVIPVVLPPKLHCEEGSYTVNNELTFEAGFESCFVYGNEAATILVHEIKNVNVRGQVLDRMDGPILLLTDTMKSIDPAMPSIESVISPPPFPPLTYRICGLTGTAIPIKGLRMRRTE